MKNKVLILLMILLSITGLFATGSKDSGPTEITVLMSANAEYPNGKTMMDMAIEKLLVDYPDTIVTVNLIDLSDGSTLTMDAMLAAGTAPNIYMDTIVRSSKYMIPEYALPLNDYVSDLDKYFPAMIKPFTTGGKVLGLPQPGGVYAMCINLDLLADVGYVLPAAEDWTIAEFLKMCKLVKAKYDGKKFGTGMFAANQSGDYLINNWFASFGVEYYRDGFDYTTIKETGGVKAYEFFQLLNKNRYIPEHSGQLSDDDYVMQWARGELAATGFTEGWTAPYFKAGAEQGYPAFNYVFYPFPKAEGIKTVPAYFINGTIVVYKSKDARINAIAAKLAQYMNSVDIQEQASLQNVVPTRSDARNLSTSIHMQEMSKIAEDNGIFNVGLTSPLFPIIRPLHYPILQKILSGEYTPDKGITEYEKAINAELK